MSFVIDENLAVNGNSILFPAKPIQLIEESIATCLALTIFKYYHNENQRNPFGNITVNISNEQVNIRTNMSESLVNHLSMLCNECYITKHLIFKKVIINKGKNCEVKSFSL